MNATAKDREKAKHLTQRQEVREIENSLKLMRERLVSALPAHIPVQSFIATVLTACTVEPKLLTCDRHSLFLSCMKAARDGILPDGREGALAPFWDSDKRCELATYMPMYPGLLKKIRNSGELESFSANAVYEKDLFEYELGDNERIVHKPLFRGARGPIIGSYAIAKVKSGGIYRRVLGEEDIKLIKDFSKAKKGPWHGAFESEMWIKSAIRRLSKILPQSTDINNYLVNGPALPASDVETALPDGTGTDALQSAEFELRTRALLVLKDESNDLDTLAGNWEGIRSEYQKINVDVPLEIEDVYLMRAEAFKEAAKK
jgi:phage RecT family recombinase